MNGCFSKWIPCFGMIFWLASCGGQNSLNDSNTSTQGTDTVTAVMRIFGTFDPASSPSDPTGSSKYSCDTKVVSKETYVIREYKMTVSVPDTGGEVLVAEVPKDTLKEGDTALVKCEPEVVSSTVVGRRVFNNDLLKEKTPQIRTIGESTGGGFSLQSDCEGMCPWLPDEAQDASLPCTCHLTVNTGMGPFLDLVFNVTGALQGFGVLWCPIGMGIENVCEGILDPKENKATSQPDQSGNDLFSLLAMPMCLLNLTLNTTLGCGETTAPPPDDTPTCGNGKSDPGEQCDSSVPCPPGVKCELPCRKGETCAGPNDPSPCTCQPIAGGGSCGDGTCDARGGEDCNTCSADCGPCGSACGNNNWDPGEECEISFGGYCGLGVCDPGTCLCDASSCGNTVCESEKNEFAYNCPQDCSAVCGDGSPTHSEACDPPNGFCVVYGRDGSSVGGFCNNDCTLCDTAIQVCNDGYVTGTEKCDPPFAPGAYPCYDPDSGQNGFCTSDCLTCDTSTPACGDGWVTGNEACDSSAGGTCYLSLCLSDCSACGPTTCGNGTCENDAGEYCYSCEADCGVCE